MARQIKSSAKPSSKRSNTQKVLVLHGPNLNLLGAREPGIYGSETLAQLNARLRAKAKHLRIDLDTLQSNYEGELIERVHRCLEKPVDFIVINPAGFTHSSVALRDALSSVRVQFIEVHLSNVHAREPFRRHSYFSDLARGVICGFGAMSYELALEYIAQMREA
jgi:3-dehydroquinate dehydratase II